MINIKVAHYDDNWGDQNNVSSYIKSLNLDFANKGIACLIELIKYDNHETLQKEIGRGVNFELLILDMYNDNDGSRVGENVLTTINALKNKIPTIIFTQAFLRGNTADFKGLYKKYNFIFGDRITKDEPEELINRIIKYLYSTHILDFDQFRIDEDDILLRAEIMGIGRINLNEILFQIKNDIEFNGKFLINRMSSGFSGAAVFKLSWDNVTKVLKISKDIEKLQNEYERAKSYYPLFPPRFIVGVESKDYSNNEVAAYLIGEAGGFTLFDWLSNNNDFAAIQNVFEKLYLSKGGLRGHYKIRRNTILSKYDQIFNKFDDIKISMLKHSITELNSIIEKLCNENPGKYQFNKVDFFNILSANKSYKNINKNELLDSKYSKPLTLCHGDFHSKNILIEDENSSIIDTGGIGYDYWCSDITRLIVNLFSVGIDNATYSYYDLSIIQRDFEFVKKIIRMEFSSKELQNNSFTFSIVWLINNVEKIYDDLFSKWEFQLGLAKEFLQVSYRTNSIPPGKRATALLAAYECIVCANEELQHHILLENKIS